MIWLLPAAGCSIIIAAILKVNERRGGDRLVLAGANYIAASAIGLMILRGRIGIPGGLTALLGTLTGVDYVLALLVLMAGISRSPLAAPVTVMRLSVVVPVAASMIFWGEEPVPSQLGGIVLGIVAIVLIGSGLAGERREGSDGRSHWLIMLSIFLVNGLAAVLLKTFQELSPDADRQVFTWILFTVAAVFTWIVIAARRRRVKKSTFLLGLMLGLPNLFSTVFTLLALRTAPASIAFPFINVTVILGSALVGFLVWKEKLGRLAIAGIAAAVLALVLIPIK